MIDDYLIDEGAIFYITPCGTALQVGFVEPNEGVPIVTLVEPVSINMLHGICEVASAWEANEKGRWN